MFINPTDRMGSGSSSGNLELKKPVTGRSEGAGSGRLSGPASWTAESPRVGSLPLPSALGYFLNELMWRWWGEGRTEPLKVL